MSRARELLAAEYDRIAEQASQVGHPERAERLRGWAKAIRDGQRDLNAVRAIDAALSLPAEGENEIIERCAGVCDDLAAERRRRKSGNGFASSVLENQAATADRAALAIRALKTPEPDNAKS